MPTLGASIAGNSPTSPTPNYHVSCLEHMSDVREMASRLRQQAADLYKELHGNPHKVPASAGAEKAAKNPEGFFDTAHSMLNMAADSLKEAMTILNDLR